MSPSLLALVFLDLDSLLKKSLSGFFVKENFTYPSRHPQLPTKQKIHLCFIHWILVLSDTVNDLILFGGHCDLYIMVQRFCLVSLTISNRKTSNRSLKQTAARQVVRGQPFLYKNKEQGTSSRFPVPDSLFLIDSL